MVMGVNPPACFLAGFHQSLQPDLPVPVVLVNRPALVTPRHDVISRPSIFDSHSSRHWPAFSPFPIPCQLMPLNTRPDPVTTPLWRGPCSSSFSAPARWSRL